MKIMKIISMAALFAVCCMQGKAQNGIQEMNSVSGCINSSNPIDCQILSKSYALTRPVLSETVPLNAEDNSERKEKNMNSGYFAVLAVLSESDKSSIQPKDSYATKRQMAENGMINIEHNLDLYGSGFVNMLHSYDNKPFETTISLHYRPTMHWKYIDFGLCVVGSRTRDQSKPVMFDRVTNSIEYGLGLGKKLPLSENHAVSALIGYNRFNSQSVSTSVNQERTWHRYGYKLLLRLAFVPNASSSFAISPVFLLEYKLTEGVYSFNERETISFQFGISINITSKSKKTR